MVGGCWWWWGWFGLLRSLVTVTQSTETKEVEGMGGVYVLQKSTPRRVRYNWVVDLGE